MNPWLITWEPCGDRADRQVRNRIAAILPNQTGEKKLTDVMQLLYANHVASSGLSETIYVSEQVRFARRDHPGKAVRMWVYPCFSCGDNPFLLARPVFNLKVAKDADYNETLTWEEDFYPALEPGKDAWEQIQALMPFKRKRRVFSTKTNTISTISTLNND